jgi:hypothetical protein
MSRNSGQARREAERRLVDAVRRRQELKQTLAERAGLPGVGDIFLFPGATLLAFRWVAALKHPDRPLLFVVPVDTAPFVGSADVEVARQERGGRMVLRCASGLWVEMSAFQPELRVAWLEPSYVKRAQAKLEQVARGRLDGTAGQRETDASPAYDDWLEQVGAAVEDLRAMLRDRHATVSLKEDSAVICLPETLLGGNLAETAAPHYAQAAAPAWKGPSGAEAGEELQGVLVPFPCPGCLLLALEGAGVGVRYFAASGEEPPALAQICPGSQAVSVAWSHTPDRDIWWSEVAWTEGRAVLRFGGGDEEREITVEP